MSIFGKIWAEIGIFYSLFESAESMTFVASKKQNIVLFFDDFTNYFIHFYA
jgi:hypothetical protein